MLRSMLKSKLHRLTVTQADLHYEGSITLDPALLSAADILPCESVEVWNVSLGTRFRTYAMVGEPNTGVVCINGAAARLVQPGDVVIVATFVALEESECRDFKPKIVMVDSQNRIRQADAVEVPGPHHGGHPSINKSSSSPGSSDRRIICRCRALMNPSATARSIQVRSGSKNPATFKKPMGLW